MGKTDLITITNQDDAAKLLPVSEPEIVSESKQALIEALAGGKGKKYAKFTMAVLGSIPWFGSLLTAAANLSGAITDLTGANDQDQINQLLALWVEEHEEKIKNLSITLNEIYSRFDNFSDEVQKRVESEEYLALVRRGFRSWDQADTEEKRQMYKRLLINAGATTLCADDLVRLFISWIDTYHEAHFVVIREIFNNPGITRGAIWDNIYGGERPRDDTSQAGLFAYLIRDLSTGGVIHQETETNSLGQALKKHQPKHRGQTNTVKKSPFNDVDPYVLTELGKEFVHYVMKDVAIQIGPGNQDGQSI